MNPLPNNRRRPEYLSPSALMQFEKDPVEYFRRYVAAVKAPRMEQTRPMSVGSAFDAYVKSYLHHHLYGATHPESNKYQIDALLPAQVEAQNLDWARKAGAHCFEAYKNSGALADLMQEIGTSVDEPRFEFELRNTVQGTKMGVPLLGKPDLSYINGAAAQVIHDWKVNGYCGKGNTSPKAGYIQVREYNGDWMRKGAHKDAFIQEWKGVRINTGAYMEMYDQEWALQLSTYSWLLGRKVGEEVVISIDQLCGNGAKQDSQGRCTLRIASHRLRVSSDFQINCMARYQHLWSLLTDEPFYFFRDMSFEKSEEKCKLLDDQCAAMSDPTLTSDEQWVMQLGRTQ